MASKILLFLLLGLTVASTAVSEPPKCRRDFKKIGCYYEDGRAEMLINDRDKSSPFYEGITIDWSIYDVYLHGLACRCSVKAKNGGYDHFALRFYGICLGTKSPAEGWLVPEKRCAAKYNGTIQDCTSAVADECVGRDIADYIYEVGQDGGYSEFGAYGPCSTSCGEGVETRSRECNNPIPRANGNTCDALGPATESRACKIKDCPVDGGFGEWSTFSDCTKTCDGGVQLRTRNCDNPAPIGGGKDCDGPRQESRGCKNDLCPGVEGVAKAQELVDNFLKGFHKTKFPDKEPSGKFYKAIFDIQKAVADEFISVDPTAKGKKIEERLLDLENFLKVATAGGSINFARVTLGKGLFTFMKKNIQDGLPIDDIDRAASNYLEKVKDDVGGDLFSQLLSSQGDVTLMFAIDTTGSMSDEIAAAKAIAKAIIDQTRDFKVDYILSPFNDPSTGPVTYKSESERAGFVSAIDGLTANGGGDCPELAIKGMSNALDAGPRYASPMFVFTDASALDDAPENVAALKASAAANSATINFFANLQGCPEKGIKTYEEIASYTAGQLFPLSSDAELLKFTSYVSKSLSADTVIASGGTRNTGRPRRSVGGKSHTFNIDDGISEFAVSVSVTTQNTASQVTLTRPDGSPVAATTSMALVAIFEVKSPPSGTWTLTFPGAVGEYTFNVQAVSTKAMEFAHYFVYQESAARNSPPFALENPVRDVPNMMVIRLGGVELMDDSSLRCDLVDERNNILVGDLKLQGLDSSEVKKTTVTPPNQPFKVRLSGKTKSGLNFQRQSRSASSPVQAFMRVTYAGNEFTATLGQTNVQIQIQVFNLGAQEDVTFTARATYGQVTPATQTAMTRRSTFIRLAYNAPNDTSKKGKTDRITVIATSTSGSKYSTSLEILLV